MSSLKNRKGGSSSDRMWISYYVKVLEKFLHHIKLNLWWNYHILHYPMFVFHATEKVGEFTIKKFSIHFCQSVCQFKYLSMLHWSFLPLSPHISQYWQRLNRLFMMAVINCIGGMVAHPISRIFYCKHSCL